MRHSTLPYPLAVLDRLQRMRQAAASAMLRGLRCNEPEFWSLASSNGEQESPETSE